MSDACHDDEVDSELMVLSSIYEDKLKLEDNDEQKVISITIYPATADDKSSQYVFLEISFTLPKEYPLVPPIIEFSLSRGLSESDLQELEENMNELAKGREGECIIFDLMELAKDSLTSNNIPSCECSICLSNFHEDDDFLKTECYHYFHCHCLWNYYNHLTSNNEDKESKDKDASMPCPVCRLSLLKLDYNQLANAKPPILDILPEPDHVFTKQHHEKYDELYQKQLKNGGLIDLEYEQNKLLLSNIQKTYKTRMAAAATSSLREQDGTSDVSAQMQDSKDALHTRRNDNEHKNNGKYHQGKPDYRYRNRPQPHWKKGNYANNKTYNPSYQRYRGNNSQDFTDADSRTRRFDSHGKNEKIFEKCSESEDKNQGKSPSDVQGSKNKPLNKHQNHEPRMVDSGTKRGANTPKDTAFTQSSDERPNSRKQEYKPFGHSRPYYRNYNAGYRHYQNNHKPHRYDNHKAERRERETQNNFPKRNDTRRTESSVSS